MSSGGSFVDTFYSGKTKLQHINTTPTTDMNPNTIQITNTPTDTHTLNMDENPNNKNQKIDKSNE